MFFPLFILTRILFAASTVFIIGYIFGRFSQRPVLARLAKIASILVIVLFFATNAFIFRGGAYGHCGYGGMRCGGWYSSGRHGDTTIIIHK